MVGRPSDRNKVDLPFSPVPGEGSFPAWTTSSGISWCAARGEKPSRLPVVRQCQHTCQLVLGGRLFSLESLSSVVIRNDVSEPSTRWKTLQVYLECYGLVHYKRRFLFYLLWVFFDAELKEQQQKKSQGQSLENRTEANIQGTMCFDAVNFPPLSLLLPFLTATFYFSDFSYCFHLSSSPYSLSPTSPWQGTKSKMCETKLMLNCFYLAEEGLKRLMFF